MLLKLKSVFVSTGRGSVKPKRMNISILSGGVGQRGGSGTGGGRGKGGKWEI